MKIIDYNVVGTKLPTLSVNTKFITENNIDNVRSFNPQWDEYVDKLVSYGYVFINDKWYVKAEEKGYQEDVYFLIDIMDLGMEVLGWRIISEKYKKAVIALLNLEHFHFNFERFENEVWGMRMSESVLRECGVLNIWFVPVLSQRIFNIGQWVKYDNEILRVEGIDIENENVFVELSDGSRVMSNECILATDVEIGRVFILNDKNDVVVRKGQVYFEGENVTSVWEEVYKCIDK